MTKEIVVDGSEGVGLSVILFLIFLVLKLTGAIAWSWWWVTAPLWIPFALVVAIFLIVVIISLVRMVIR